MRRSAAATSVRYSHTFISLALLLLTVAVPAFAQDSTASIGTDKLDYMPGDVVSIFGRNWAPGETVTMVLHEDPNTCLRCRRERKFHQHGFRS
jgi:hypothetical protein